MAQTVGQPKIRETLLSVIDEQVPKSPMDASLQFGSVFAEVEKRLGLKGNRELEQALLTQWHELFRTGYLAWGLDLNNPDAPFFHLTRQGRETLSRLSRDPGNPSGYLMHLHSEATLNPIADSYVLEAVQCFVGGQYKAAAVMVGASSEAVLLGLRDVLVERLKDLGEGVPRKISEWRISRVIQGLTSFYINAGIGGSLEEACRSYLPAFSQQIRAARNEAGHPRSVEAVTPETVYASLLIFPELCKLASQLEDWTTQELA